MNVGRLVMALMVGRKYCFRKFTGRRPGHTGIFGCTAIKKRAGEGADVKGYSVGDDDTCMTSKVVAGVCATNVPVPTIWDAMRASEVQHVFRHNGMEPCVVFSTSQAGWWEQHGHGTKD